MVRPTPLMLAIALSLLAQRAATNSGTLENKAPAFPPDPSVFTYKSKSGLLPTQQEQDEERRAMLAPNDLVRIGGH
jgi:hypothetical protein